MGKAPHRSPCPPKHAGLWVLPLALSVATGLLVFVPLVRSVGWVVCAPALCSMAFWFYGILSAVGALTTVILAQRFRALTTSLTEPPERMPVAILYVCCGDFRPDCAATLLAQDYPELHVFVLDDSESKEEQARVRTWCAAHDGSVSYLHRPQRRAYKAGNLNYGLAMVPAYYGGILVCDADERLGRRTVRELVTWLTAEPKLAWVQAIHTAAPSPSGFATALEYQVACAWQILMPWRVWFGLGWNLGHGVLLRRTALASLGGFPEVSSEDIILTGALLQNGWSGTCVWTSDGAQEEAPETFERFCRRLLRWTSQDTNTALRHTIPMLSARNLPWAERIDWLVRNAKFPICGLTLPFLVALGTLALAFPEWRNAQLPTATVLTPVAATCAPVMAFAFFCRHQWWRLPAVCASALTISVLCLPVLFQALVAGLVGWSTGFAPTGATLLGQKGRRSCPLIALFAGGSLLTLGWLAQEPLIGIIGGLLFAAPILIAMLPFCLLRWCVFGLVLLGVALHVCGFGSAQSMVIAGAALAVLWSP